MGYRGKFWFVVLTLLTFTAVGLAGTPAGAQQKPNIVVIMGDDIGIWNIGAYHRGMMAGRTPNLDKIAAEGMLFTDYYAEASCTAGRANFITGELPIRTGMTTVGQAGAPIGLPAEAVTIATALKAMGYATGQFGKNHLGDRERVPAHRARLRRVLRLPLSPRRDGRPLPSELSAGSEDAGRPAQHGPLVGDQRRTTRPWIRAGARSASRRSRTRASCARNAWKPWTTRSATSRSSSSTRPRPTTSRSSCGSIRRACTSSRTCRRSTRRCATPKNGWSIHEAGMAQLDDDIGIVMKKLKDMGVDDNTIVVFTTDNGTEVFTWPDGGQTPFAQSQGHGHGRRLPRAGDDPLAGQGAGGQGRERHHLRARLVPDLRGRRRQSRTSPRS